MKKKQLKKSYFYFEKETPFEKETHFEKETPCEKETHFEKETPVEKETPFRNISNLSLS